MSAFLSGDVSEWSFPDVDITPPCDAELTAVLDRVAQEEIVPSPEVNTPVVPDAPHPVVHDKAAEELKKIKNDYETRLATLNLTLKKIENSLSSFDSELVALIQAMVKTTVKKIIYKEIEVDPTLVPNAMKELAKLIQAQSGIMHVFLSEHDFQLLPEREANPKQIIQMDPALKMGDVVIKSNFTEIRALLEERIEQIIGMKHE